MDKGHWEYPGEFDPEEWFGFIYRIIEKDTGREYIGKKQLWSTRRVPVKGRKNRKIKRKESDWRTYTSSSKHLNEAIEEKGMDNYIFRIESLHEKKGTLYYREVELQVKEDTLIATLENGTPKFYNRQIGSVKFIPPKPTLKEVNSYAAYRGREGVLLNESG